MRKSQPLGALPPKMVIFGCFWWFFKMQKSPALLREVLRLFAASQQNRLPFGKFLSMLCTLKAKGVLSML